jgi:hypothetical protein
VNATARRIVRPAPIRDLFAVPASVMEAALAPILSPPPLPVPEPALAQPPRALRIRRDFAAPRELVWGCDGRRFVCRDVASFNGRPAYHVYTAWELADAVFYGVTVEGLTPAASRAYGRVDTRRPLRSLADDTRAPFDWQRACEAEARDLIHELCPETVLRIAYKDVGGKDVEVAVGAYDRPGDVLLTVDPAFRFAAAKAAWRPT